MSCNAGKRSRAGDPDGSVICDGEEPQIMDATVTVTNRSPLADDADHLIIRAASFVQIEDTESRAASTTSIVSR